jgi:rod shape determining protein RodA
MRSNALFRYKWLQKFSQMHWPLVILVLVLGSFGCAMMYSAGGGNIHPWADNQMLRFGMGIALMVVLALTPSQIILRYAYLFYGFCLMVLITVEIAGYVGKGAQRWVSIGMFNLQPSEFMKIAVILALARYFHSLGPDAMKRDIFLIPPIFLVLIPVVLILKQPNLGTATITAAVGVIIFFTVGVKWRYFIGIAAAGLASLPVAWHFLHDYQKQRVLTFLNPEADPLGSGYNIMQSMIAIGSGGFFGKGFIQGSQGQLDFLPEKQTDFIFTMIAEEFGFFGCLIVLVMIAMVILLCVGICVRSKSLFGSVLAIGIAGMLFVHMWINIAMVMGLIPVVGVPLPMLSYGGSIMITMMMGFGLVLNAWVHRDVNLNRNAWGGF